MSKRIDGSGTEKKIVLVWMKQFIEPLFRPLTVGLLLAVVGLVEVLRCHSHGSIWRYGTSDP